MNKLDFQEIQRHISILNVAYQLCLEIVSQKGNEVKAICPFCGYNNGLKQPTLSLNILENKYHCFRCGKSGFSIGLYATMKDISNKKAFQQLIETECFSMDSSNISVVPLNEIADIKTRDIVYRDFLSMLKLSNTHKQFLLDKGFLPSTIKEQMYRTSNIKYAMKRLIAYRLSKKYNLAGIPGFFQEEDFNWNFSCGKGLIIPSFDEYGYIQGLLIQLDKPYNNQEKLWFSSNYKLNGTASKNWVSKCNINEYTKTIALTDDILMFNLMKEVLNAPAIGFSDISNTYQIVKELENTNIENIIFTIRTNPNQRFEYLVERLFRDLNSLGYNLDFKVIYNDFKAIFEKDFMTNYTLDKCA